MDDRPDIQKRLDSLTEEQREELKGFLRRFDEQVDLKIEQLLYETQDPGRLSDEALEIRTRLLEGFVPLIDDDGELTFRNREALSLEDTRRFGRFMDRDAARRQREILDGEIW
jgi:hypothetical protein